MDGKNIIQDLIDELEEHSESAYCQACNGETEDVLRKAKIILNRLNKKKCNYDHTWFSKSTDWKYCPYCSKHFT
jgi:hypothetical protein